MESTTFKEFTHNKTHFIAFRVDFDLLQKAQTQPMHMSTLHLTEPGSCHTDGAVIFFNGGGAQLTFLVYVRTKIKFGMISHSFVVIFRGTPASSICVVKLGAVGVNLDRLVELLRTLCALALLHFRFWSAAAGSEIACKPVPTPNPTSIICFSDCNTDWNRRVNLGYNVGQMINMGDI